MIRMILASLSRLVERRRRRDIFQFWDGRRIRRIDPLVAWRVMWQHPTCNVSDDLNAADNGDFEAQARALAMTRDMFGVQAWSEDSPGLTVDETYSLLCDFLDYMGRKKKAPGSSPPPSPPSDSTFCPEAAEASTMPPESGSSSTRSESSAAAPITPSKPSLKF